MSNNKHENKDKTSEPRDGSAVYKESQVQWSAMNIDRK